MKLKNEKLSFYIDSENYKRLLVLCAKENKTKSEVVRSFLIEGLTLKTTRDDIDFICRIISKQMEAVLKRDIERIVSLVVKAILSSQNTNYLCIEMLKDKNEIVDIREIKDKAHKYAVEYLKIKNKEDM